MSNCDCNLKNCSSSERSNFLEIEHCIIFQSVKMSKMFSSKRSAQNVQLKMFSSICSAQFVQNILSWTFWAEHFELNILSWTFRAEHFELNNFFLKLQSINILIRVASFAKFREMQKMVLRKNFREKWMQNFAKMISDFDLFWAQFGTIKSSNWG